MSEWEHVSTLERNLSPRKKKRRIASTTCWLKQANEFLKKKSEKESNCEMVLSQTL